MVEVDLTREIAAFERLAPELRLQDGPPWVVILGAEVRGRFPTFDQAMAFAFDSFGDADFLVRELDAQRPMLPFLVLESP